MKNAALCLVFVLSLIVAGCGSKDTEINTFITASDKLAIEIVQKVKANPTSTGVDEAQKLLDDKKADLRKQYDHLKTARGYQVKEETMRKFTDSVFKNAEAVNNLKLDFMEKTLNDKKFSKKIDKLVDDFNAIYEV